MLHRFFCNLFEGLALEPAKQKKNNDFALTKGALIDAGREG
jgi:hypothetical protein